MTVDDLPGLDSRTSAAIPGPRTAEPPAGRADVGWAEPLRTRRTRPSSEYWDVEQARWVSRSPVPGPRRG